MADKKSKLEDFFTKISNVFKDDLYIIKNTYCIAGKSSDQKNISKILCMISPDIISLLKEVFPDMDYVYIQKIKESKKDIANNFTTKISDIEKKELDKTVSFIMSNVNKTKKWDSFNFSDEVSEKIFKDGELFELFKDSDIPSLTMSKSLFPMVTPKTANDILYAVYVPKNENDLVTLVSSFPTTYFQIYSIIQYIKI